MCMSSPNIETPTQYQTPKDPVAKKSTANGNQNGGMAGGSLLTGPSGAAVKAGNIAGGNSLLGG